MYEYFASNKANQGRSREGQGVVEDQTQRNYMRQSGARDSRDRFTTKGQRAHYESNKLELEINSILSGSSNDNNKNIFHRNLVYNRMIR